MECNYIIVNRVIVALYVNIKSTLRKLAYYVFGVGSSMIKLTTCVSDITSD